MPVLNVRALSSKQLMALAHRYDSLAKENLEPRAQLRSDPGRCQIDAALATALNLPDPAFIRELLEREPGLNAKDIAPRTVRPSLGIAAEGEDDDGQEASL